MNDVAERIEGIIENRRRHLPKVQAEIERWRNLDTEIYQLDRRYRSFVTIPMLPWS
jgi:hypothetical protein